MYMLGLMLRCGRRLQPVAFVRRSRQFGNCAQIGGDHHAVFRTKQPHQFQAIHISSRLFADKTSSINTTKMTAEVKESKEELKKRLTALAYQVTQEAGTERPFTGKYDKFYEEGLYQCIVCHQELFSSKTKFDAGCGWPAFNDVLDQGKITLHRDASIADRIRTEVRCAKCSAHMGHVFEDGPPPTRKRYCINSVAIEFLSADQLNSNNNKQ